jgi:hypothetical protein
MMRAFLIGAGAGVLCLVGWLAGVRYGFVRGMRGRMAGTIPHNFARTRQGAKMFGREFGRNARRAHHAELARVAKLSQAPRWRQRIYRWLFP